MRSTTPRRPTHAVLLDHFARRFHEALPHMVELAKENATVQVQGVTLDLAVMQRGHLRAHSLSP